MTESFEIGGGQKVKEYIERIKNGESKGSVLSGLSPSFVDAIEVGLKNNDENNVNKKEIEKIEVPLQYKGLNSGLLDEIWTIPEYLDPQKTEKEKAKKAAVVAILKEQENKEIKIQERKQGELERIKELENKLGVKGDKEKIFKLFNGAVVETFNHHKKESLFAFNELKEIFEKNKNTISDQTVDLLSVLGAMTNPLDMRRILNDKDYQKDIIDDFEKIINSQNGVENEKNKNDNVIDLEKIEVSERRKVVDEMLEKAQAVAPMDRADAPFKNFSDNDQESWKYVSDEEVKKYLESKFFFNTKNIKSEDMKEIFSIDEKSQIPLDLVVSAAGFEDWKGREESFNKNFKSEYSKFDRSNNEMSSLNVIKHYAGLSSEIPSVDTMRMFVQPDGKILFDNNTGDSHRIAAAILRGQSTINAQNILVFKLNKNYL